MTTEQMTRELAYRTALVCIHDLIRQGLIDGKEYVQINTILAEIFSPVWGHLPSISR